MIGQVGESQRSFGHQGVAAGHHRAPRTAGQGAGLDALGYGEEDERRIHIAAEDRRRVVEAGPQDLNVHVRYEPVEFVHDGGYGVHGGDGLEGADHHPPGGGMMPR